MINLFSMATFPRRAWATAVLLILSTIVIYAPAFNAPFVFDDLPNITENVYIRMTDVTPESLPRVLKSRSTHRPLANLSFAINYYIHGYDVRGYRIVNLAIHIITALLVWLVARQTLRLGRVKDDGFVPFLAAALWLVNPLHVQSVTYIVQRMNALAALFYLLCLAAYIQARTTDRAGRRHRLKKILYSGLCLSAGACGLLSKEIVITLPVILLIYEWFFFQNMNRTWLKRRAGWIAGAAGLILVFALIYMRGDPVEKLTTLYANQDFTPGQRLLTEAGVVIYYLSLLIFPHPARLVVDYDFPLSTGLLNPPTTLLALAALGALLLAALYAAGRRQRLTAFAILWFLVTLAVESSVIGLYLIYEHRTYLPSTVPIIALVWLVCAHLRPRSLAVGVLLVIIALGATGTYQRNRVWQTDLALWQDNVAKSPKRARPYVNLGVAYKNHGEMDPAMTAYNRACRLAAPPQEIYYIARCNLGELLLAQNRPREAAACFQEALTALPGYFNAHIDLGVALLHQGQTDAAIEKYRQILAVNPYLEKAYNNLGNAWFRKGDVPRAVKAFEQALAVNPGYPEARANLDKLSRIVNQYGPLINQHKSLLARQPNDPDLLYRLGQLSQAAGMTDQAITAYEQTLAREPDQPLYLNALANAYAAAGRFPDAAEAFERLTRLIPDNPTVFYNQACMHARGQNINKALAALQKAVECGYDNWPHLRTDKDLENIRHTAYYQELLR